MLAVGTGLAKLGNALYRDDRYPGAADIRESSEEFVMRYVRILAALSAVFSAPAVSATQIVLPVPTRACQFRARDGRSTQQSCTILDAPYRIKAAAKVHRQLQVAGVRLAWVLSQALK
jgi:hypothetical protein